MENRFQLDINQIQKFLPHRQPFLFVDRILEIHPAGSPDNTDLAPVGTKVVGLKNVSFNEPYFQGHFPKYAIMPGVILIETMAQVASFSAYPHMAKDIERLSRDFQCILVGVDHARFRRPVVPGDTLRIETDVAKKRGSLWGFQCVISVDGQKAAEAEIMANMMSKSRME